MLAYCSAGDRCGQKWNERVNRESKLRSKGKSARSLGTKSRHAGGTNGDVFRLSTWYGRTAAVVSWSKNRSPRWFYCRRCLSSAGAAWQDGSSGVVTEESVDMLVVSMTMFGVCRCGIPGWQRRCRGGCVGRHAGGTEDDDDDVWSCGRQTSSSSVAPACRPTLPPRHHRCRPAIPRRQTENIAISATGVSTFRS